MNSSHTRMNNRRPLKCRRPVFVKLLAHWVTSIGCMSRSTQSSPNLADVQSQQRLQEALNHFQAGDTTRAEALAKALLRSTPQFEPAHVLLARSQRTQGYYKHALQSCRNGLKLLPRSIALLIELALTQRAAGRLEEAEVTYRNVLSRDPSQVVARQNLANLLQGRGALDDAEALYQEVIASAPHMGQAHFELGNVHAARGDMVRAVEAWSESVRVSTHLAPAWFALGEAWRTERPRQALAAFENGLQHDPHNAKAWSMLGKLLSDMGHGGEGERCARRALQISPNDAWAHYALGLSLRVQRRLDEAYLPLAGAVQLSKDHDLTCEANYLLALCNLDQGRLVEAAQFADVLLSAGRPGQQMGMAHHVKGAILFDGGQVALAREHFAQAIASSPDYLPHRTTLCASGLYIEEDNATHRHRAEELLGSVQLKPSVIAPSFNDWPMPGPRNHKRLRVGWLSADFRQHSCAYFVEPVFDHMNADDFELFAYDTGSRPDAVMARLQARIPHWRSVEHLQASHLAGLIARDDLDVLVDLAGLTDGGRLEALSARPAPIQMAWLGYLGTCGHAALSYRLTDRWVDGPAQADATTEQAIRLDRTYVSYRAPADAPDVGPLPMLRNGHVTFGSFNTLKKLSDACVARWSAVLRAVPGSRLLLKTFVLNDSVARSNTHARFAAHGIEAERVELLGWERQVSHHLELYHRVDIALDTGPYNGVTTTCESLWMGVPVVSCFGQALWSRQGLTLLNGVGLPELACDSDASFVARCVALANDPEELGRMRSTLRDRMASSALCDEIGMTRAMEQAIRGITRSGATN